MFAAIHGGKNTPHHSNYWKEKLCAVLADFVGSSREVESGKVHWLIYDAEDEASSDHRAFWCIPISVHENWNCEMIKEESTSRNDQYAELLNKSEWTTDFRRVRDSEADFHRFSLPADEARSKHLLNVSHQTDGTADGHWAEMNGVGGGHCYPSVWYLSLSRWGVVLGKRSAEVEENKQQPSSTDAAASCWLPAVGTIVFVLTWASITQTDWAEEAEHCFLSLCGLFQHPHCSDCSENTVWEKQPPWHLRVCGSSRTVYFISFLLAAEDTRGNLSHVPPKFPQVCFWTLSKKGQPNQASYFKAGFVSTIKTTRTSKDVSVQITKNINITRLRQNWPNTNLTSVCFSVRLTREALTAHTEGWGLSKAEARWNTIDSGPGSSSVGGGYGWLFQTLSPQPGCRCALRSQLRPRHYRLAVVGSRLAPADSWK